MSRVWAWVPRKIQSLGLGHRSGGGSNATATPHSLADAGRVLPLFGSPEAGWLSFDGWGEPRLERGGSWSRALRPWSGWPGLFLSTPGRLRLLILLGLLPLLWHCGSKRVPPQTVPVVRSDAPPASGMDESDQTESLDEPTGTDLAEAVTESEPSLIWQILEVASSQIGTPYRWGGDSPDSGFDCSGFVRWVFDQLGVELPRNSRGQATVGVAVDRKDLRPGDLLFYARQRGSKRVGHVGIYLGDGQFLHSPRRGQPIQVSPAFDRYRQSVFLGARRVVSDAEADRPIEFDVTAATPSTVPAEEPEHYYVVKRGDYIWALARRFNVSPFQLLRANNLTRDAILRIGQKLLIPR